MWAASGATNGPLAGSRKLEASLQVLWEAGIDCSPALQELRPSLLPDKAVPCRLKELQCPGHER